MKSANVSPSSEAGAVASLFGGGAAPFGVPFGSALVSTLVSALGWALPGAGGSAFFRILSLLNGLQNGSSAALFAELDLPAPPFFTPELDACVAFAFLG